MSLIVGRKPVLEALSINGRVEKVFYMRGVEEHILRKVKDAIGERNIPMVALERKKFIDFVQGAHAQGIAAFGKEQDYLSEEKLMKAVEAKSDFLLLVLDEIQDPHNFGAILRSAECSGVDAVLITFHRSAGITGVVQKVSAGASERLPVCRVVNLAQTIERLKKTGMFFYGSVLDGGQSLYKTDFSGRSAIVVGNEEKGIRNLTAKMCDTLVTIPMAGHLQSLNVSVATGVFLFEILRRKQTKAE